MEIHFFRFSKEAFQQFTKFHKKEVKHDKCNSKRSLNVTSEVKNS